MIKKWMEDAEGKKHLLSEGLKKETKDKPNEASKLVESDSEDSDENVDKDVRW